MIRKRVPKLLTILATAACIFGFVLVAAGGDAHTFADADRQCRTAGVIGYDVTCTQTSDNQIDLHHRRLPASLRGLCRGRHAHQDQRRTTEQKSRSRAATPDLRRRGFRRPKFNLSFQGCRNVSTPIRISAVRGSRLQVRAAAICPARQLQPAGSKSATVVPRGTVRGRTKGEVPRGFADGRGGQPRPVRTCSGEGMPAGIGCIRRFRPARSARGRRMPSR